MIKKIIDMNSEELKNALTSDSITVCVVGIGRIGLPTALSFANSGLFTIGLDINSELIKKGVFYNLGARFEYSLSEYVRLFARPSFEYKNYTLTFPESSFSVTHNLPAFYFNLGLSWRLPDRKKCRVKN